MPRPCSVCAHAQRAEIDKRMNEGAGLVETAALFRVSKSALQRHHSRCRWRRRKFGALAIREEMVLDPEKLAKAVDPLRTSAGASRPTVDDLMVLSSYLAVQAGARALASGDPQLIMQASKEIRATAAFELETADERARMNAKPEGRDPTLKLLDAMLSSDEDTTAQIFDFLDEVRRRDR